MEKMFEHKVALVTGGTRGIGLGVLKAFAREGAIVVNAALNAQDGERVVQDLRDAGHEALFIQTDVSMSDQVNALFNQIVDSYGRIDIANNNAGVGERERVLLADVSEDNFDHVIDVNLKGVWYCMKHEIKQMLKQGGGAIVNTSSICGLVATLPGLSSYITSKHALIGLTRAAAIEYATQNIRINAVCPGSVLTPQLEFVTRDDPEEITRQAKMHPIERLGTPDEIAEAVIWLCSEKSSFILGHPLAVDGGFLAR